MKNRQHRVAFWTTGLIAAAVASGCGSPTAASDKERVATNTVSAPAVIMPPTAASVPVQPVTPEPVTVAASTATNIPLATVTNLATAPTGGEIGENAPPPSIRSVRVTPDLPESVHQVMRLVEGGAGDETVRAYVAGSNERYDLSLDQILYLRDIGIVDGVIAAMMRRDSELRDQVAASGAMQSNMVAAAEQIRQNLAAGGGNGTAAVPTGAESGIAAPPPPAPGQPQAPAPGQPGVVQAPPALPAVATAPAPADAPAEVQQFYTPLSPYGSWYQTPGYGWVWQPSVVVVNRGWTPYGDAGRWVWTDHGWYWHSEYSWGWAPFHYGRWFTYPGIGWCWAPDTTWGPSWVTWRYSDGYMGWAALPPRCGWRHGVGLTWYGESVQVGFSFGLAASCYTFVPRHAFGHRNLSHHAVRGDNHRTAYDGSVTVNNIIKGNNNTIINNGIGYDNIAKNVRGEIPKARVQPLPSESNQPLRADRLEKGKDGLVVYRPQPVATAGGTPTSHISPEVRPASAFANGTPTRPSPAQRLGGVPSRTGSASPSSSGVVAAPSASKPVDSRGSAPSARPQATPANPVMARPSAPQRPSAVSQSQTPTRSAAPSSAAKPIDARSGSVGASPASGAGGNSVNAPRREITPVPLADPSRNLPTRPAAPSARAPVPMERGAGGNQPAVAPTRPTSVRSASEGRSGGNAVPSSQAAPSAAPSRAPTYNAVPSGGNARPSYSAPSPSYTPSAPAPAAGGGQRPSYSAPSPAMSAPRPSYSAPAPAAPPSPAMSAPRPSYSAPAPSAPPSAPASGSSPSRGGSDGSGSSRGGSGSRGGSRSQVD